MSISLLGSINVCKVNTGYADKIQSDRFENPDVMTCPLWNGQDSFGRFVHPDSFYTKNGGCNSADDRVAVENFLRPQYMEYVALDAAGFRSPNMFGNPNQTKEGWQAPQQQYNQYNNQQYNNARNGYVENWDPNPKHNQLSRDSLETAREVQDYYQIVGSAGYDYRATNTPYDTGYNGVNGGGPLGCGNRYSSRIQENFTADPYAPDNRSDYNYNNRTQEWQYQGAMSNNSRCNSGF
jgi:hypothetical protein